MLVATHNAGGIDPRSDRIVRMENGTLLEWVPGTASKTVGEGSWRKASS